MEQQDNDNFRKEKIMYQNLIAGLLGFIAAGVFIIACCQIQMAFGL